MRENAPAPAIIIIIIKLRDHSFIRTGDIYLSDIGREISPLTKFHVNGSLNNTRTPVPFVTEDIGRLGMYR